MAKKKVAPPSGKKNILFIALLLLVTFGIYFQVTSHEFVNYDDDTLITTNRVVVDAGKSWTDCFTWNIFTPHFKPLVLLSWRAEYQAFGEKPGVFLFNNLLLHAFNVPVDSRRGRQPKDNKTSPDKELDKPVLKKSSNNNQAKQENNINSCEPSLEPEEKTDETKFSFYLDTQGTGTFVSETLQLLIASGKLSNSVLRLNISIEEM